MERSLVRWTLGLMGFLDSLDFLALHLLESPQIVILDRDSCNSGLFHSWLSGNFLRLVLHTLDLLVLDVESLRVHFKSQTAFLENLLTFAHSFFLLQILCKIYLSILSSHDLFTLWLLMILLRSLIVLDQLIYAILTISLLASRSTLEDFLSCLVVVLSH
jgi:hypothetical protein